MMTEPTLTVTERRGNCDDAEYDAFLARMQERFVRNVRTDSGVRPVFLTDAAGLWETYLSQFTEGVRQFHNCHACRRFIEQYGSLVTIDPDGTKHSAIWHADDAPYEYHAAVSALARAVRRASVVSQFASMQSEWGQRETGAWKHMAITPPPKMLAWGNLFNAGQRMAVVRELFKTMRLALHEFSSATVDTAITLLKGEALYRSEKVLGQAEFLARIHADRSRAKGAEARDNVLWLAVATAPEGFCHPRSSMIGTLLEDIAAGMSLPELTRRFAAKMHPLQYQRPQAAPTSGNIAAAEKLVEKLGIAPSLRRRFARVEEIEAVWRPIVAEEPQQTGSVFSHLLPKSGQPASPQYVLPTQTITWEKFARTVLPEAKSMELQAPAFGHYAAYLTASDADAPPILQWDGDDPRNPFSWFLYHPHSAAVQWSISPAWTKVTAISLQPNQWHNRVDHNGRGVMFVLKGCRDKQTASLCLFPETLRSELREVRSVIEAYSRAGKLEGQEEASACGLMMQGTGGLGGLVRVNGTGMYKIDRWD